MLRTRLVAKVKVNLLAAFAGASLLSATRVEAQSADLPAQGTAAVTFLFHGTGADGLGGPAYGRWSGRVGLRVVEGLYIGVGGGSWEVPIVVLTGGPNGPHVAEDSLSNLAAAVTYGAYGQLYPAHSLGLFMRGGLGLANTSTYYPFGNVIYKQSATRFSLTAGVGWDIRVKRPFYITPAVDYTRLTGVPAGPELSSALALSLGLTIR